MLAGLWVSGCSIPPDASGPTNVIRNRREFGRAFEALQTAYIEPIAPKDIMQRAMTGLQGAPSAPQPQSSQIVAAALRQVALLQTDDTRAMRNQFNSATDAIRALPGAPSDTILLQAAITGMVAGLDKDSGFEKASAGAPGPQAATGIGIAAKDGGFGVNTLFLPSPAAEAGVRLGDVVTAVNGRRVRSLAIEDVIVLLRGPEGSEVVLSVLRDGQPLEIKIIRRPVNATPVRGRVVEGAIYIRPSLFLPRTGEQTHELLRDLQRQEPHATGVILDMRWNYGGIWPEVRSVASAFLPRNTFIADVRARRHGDDDHVMSRGGDVTGGLPLVVLVDGETGSGSEVVAAALQASHRAVVLGRSTSGSGALATVFPLAGLGLLRLTTGRITLANGKSLAGSPVVPDAVLPARAGEHLVVADDGSAPTFTGLATVFDRAPSPGMRFFAPDRPNQDLQVLAAASFLHARARRQSPTSPNASP